MLVRTVQLVLQIAILGTVQVSEDFRLQKIPGFEQTSTSTLRAGCRVELAHMGHGTQTVGLVLPHCQHTNPRKPQSWALYSLIFTRNHPLNCSKILCLPPLHPSWLLGSYASGLPDGRGA